MPEKQKRYAISFTPSPDDSLAIVGANWVGRNAFSDSLIEPQVLGPLGFQEIAYNTALPRRYGFQAMLKSPFWLSEGFSESMLLNDLMRFATRWEPFFLSPLSITLYRDTLALAPVVGSPAMNALSASIVSEFDRYRSPLTEAEIERRGSESMNSVQFTNLYRWGEPDVMSAFYFHMQLTGPLDNRDRLRFQQVVREFFGPFLIGPVAVSNIALFVEEEPDAPFVVHSLHPMGALPARRMA